MSLPALKAAPSAVTLSVEDSLSLASYERPSSSAGAPIGRLSPRSPYDWSLDDQGAAYHIEAASGVLPADLDPDIAPAFSRPLVRLEQGRETRLEYLRSMAAALVAVAFFAAIGGAALHAAAIRLPEVRQASIDAEGV